MIGHGLDLLSSKLLARGKIGEKAIYRVGIEFIRHFADTRSSRQRCPYTLHGYLFGRSPAPVGDVAL